MTLAFRFPNTSAVRAAARSYRNATSILNGPNATLMPVVPVVSSSPPRTHTRFGTSTCSTPTVGLTVNDDVWSTAFERSSATAPASSNVPFHGEYAMPNRYSYDRSRPDDTSVPCVRVSVSWLRMTRTPACQCSSGTRSACDVSYAIIRPKLSVFVIGLANLTNTDVSERLPFDGGFIGSGAV